MKYFVLLFCPLLVLAQQPTGSISGTVADAESQIPLIGATVALYSDSTPSGGTVTDLNGNFSIPSASLGRHSIVVRYLGYKMQTIPDVIVTSAKEVVLQVKLEPDAFAVKEIKISAVRPQQVINEMSAVSARQFSVDETNRFAGSRGDPARMAGNFAGVQGADDSRNDIVIRGNSPQGLLWRLEGIDIFNPSHFNIPGTAGGPVSILNNKFLGNSDFFTGAFPADYGNSVAGAFDLRMRNGNKNHNEFSAQFGFLGTELLGEGPVSKKTGSSFLAMYRYSTLAIFGALGIDVGTNAIPHYQDAAFRLFFPLKKNFTVALFGVGGMSNVDILISKQTKPERNIYGENDRDQYFASRMGVTGITIGKILSEKTYSKLTIAAQGEQVNAHHELVFRHTDADSLWHVDSLVHLLGYQFVTSKISLGWYLNSKITPRFTLKFGLNADQIFFNYLDSIRITDDTADADYWKFITRWNSKTTAQLIQPFFQTRFSLSRKLDLFAGWHVLIFTLNNQNSFLEPRLALKFSANQKQQFALGFGMHSQLQPTYLYFYGGKNVISESQLYNLKMSPTNSTHLVFSWNAGLRDYLTLKTEIYYQTLSKIPVDIRPSSFSMVNTGAGFSRFFPDTLQKTGTAVNRGIELTLEKSFHKHLFYLLTASLFDSKYKGSDGVEHNTDFNGRYILNALVSREWTVKKKNSFSLGGKITYSGGHWYGLVDTAASEIQKEVIYLDSLRNSKQFASYFRADAKLNYRINAKRVTHEIGLDLVNLFNTKNILKLTYAPSLDSGASPIREEYQLGFLPLFYYKADF